MDKMLLACPTCGTFYSVKSGAVDHQCERCGTKLEAANISYVTWEQMTESQRERYKKAYREKTDYKSYEEVPESSWTTALGCLGWMIVIGGVVGAVAVVMSGMWPLAIVPLAAGFMCAAAAMVLKEVAHDVRATRNMMQRHVRQK